ncbi:hypothetical protein Lesp01_78780 [Lentzea sp. NBRC 102530]|nr:hypothetical protein Lesp01_78780 [Lentzea sp. NBRC 102530]
MPVWPAWFDSTTPPEIVAFSAWYSTTAAFAAVGTTTAGTIETASAAGKANNRGLATGCLLCKGNSRARRRFS